jgi:hypothetical protein
MSLRVAGLGLASFWCFAVTADAAGAAAQPAPTNAELFMRVWESISHAFKALPMLREAPRHWLAATADLDNPVAIGQRFWLTVLMGVAAASLTGWAIQRLFDRGVFAAVGAHVSSRLRNAVVRLVVSLFTAAVFVALFWAVLASMAGGNRLLAEAADRIALAAFEWRLALLVLTVVLSPGHADLRLPRMNDADAARCMRWLRVYAVVAPFAYCLIWLIDRIGFADDAVFGLAAVMGIATTVYKIAAIWAIRHPIARAILGATDAAPPPLRRVVAAGWHWLFTVLALVIMVASFIAFSLGEGGSVYGAATATQLILVALAIGWQITQKLIDHLYVGSCDVLGLRGRRFTGALRRLCDLLFLVVGLAWLGEVWGFDLIAPAPGSGGQLVLRPVIAVIATCIAAWIVWLVISGVIDEKMPQAMGPGDDDGDASERCFRCCAT